MSLIKKLSSLFNGVANSVGGGDKVSKKCEVKKKITAPRFFFDDPVRVIEGFYKGLEGRVVRENLYPIPTGIYYSYVVRIQRETTYFDVELHSTLLEKIEDGNSD